MKNERGEIVTGVMIVIMAGMMIFGMFFMHGGHGDHRDGSGHEQKQHSDKEHHHMHDGVSDKDPATMEDGKK